MPPGSHLAERATDFGTNTQNHVTTHLETLLASQESQVPQRRKRREQRPLAVSYQASVRNLIVCLSNGQIPTTCEAFKRHSPNHHRLHQRHPNCHPAAAVLRH
jgi:hypothetical protein